MRILKKQVSYILTINGEVQPEVGRLETAGGKHRHSPTVETLSKYAKAVNCKLQIKFVPKHRH